MNALQKLTNFQKSKNFKFSRTRNLGGGTTLDLGVYTIQVSLWAFREEPIAIKATGTINADGVDLAMKGELTFSGGRKAKIETSAFEKLRNKAVIKGTKGQITLHDFWCCINITDIDGTEKSWPLPPAKFDFFFPNSCGLRYETDEVKRCIRTGLLECENVSHAESLRLARIEDEIRKQIGVIFDEDSQY